jgi:hypothetical protein
MCQMPQPTFQSLLLEALRKGSPYVVRALVDMYLVHLSVSRSGNSWLLGGQPPASGRVSAYLTCQLVVGPSWPVGDRHL